MWCGLWVPARRPQPNLPILALLLLLHPLAANAEPIAEIAVSGNRRVDAETVRAAIPLKTGGPYDDRAADAALKALLATGLFSDVRIERRGAAVHITVAENPVVRSIAFEGNANHDKATLTAEVQLKAGAPYTAAKAQADARRIRDLYRRQGRLDTAVEVRSREEAQHRIDVVFVVKEGPVVKVNDITFTGNRAFSSGQLADVIVTTRSGLFDFLKKTSTYDPDRLALDRELLRLHYLKHGYADARITAADARLAADGSGHAITFTIEEGARYSYGRIALESSIEGTDIQRLRGEIKPKVGAVFNAEEVQKTAERLTLLLAESGHPFAVVTPKPARDAASRTVAVTFAIVNGPPQHVERIEIVGNRRTRDHVIRRELGLAEGGPLNKVLLARSITRLKRLGFFKTVEVKTTPGSAPGQIVLAVVVEEQETGELSFGAGYSTSEGIVGDIAIGDRNLLGGGQSLRLKLAGSMTRFQGELSFTEPRLLDSHLSAGFDLFHKDVDLSRSSSYKQRRTGGDVRVGYQLTDEWRATLNYTLTRNEIYDVGPGASAAIRQAVPGFPATSTSTYWTSSAGYSVSRDTRDRERLPTSGTSFVLSQDLAGLGGDVRFVKSTMDMRGYLPVTESVVLAGRVTAGNIEGWGGSEVRLLDMYFLGGESVRGFATRGIGPRDMSSLNQDALGGKNYLTASAEARFGLPFAPQELGVRGAAFVDTGTLFGSTQFARSLPGVASTGAQVRASAGVGIIWDSPIGALRADYAVPLMKQSTDKLQPWSFGMVGW